MSKELFQASEEGSEDDVRRLIERGVDVNTAVGRYGKTALHQASWNGHVDIVSLLLAAGADIHAVDKNDSTALHYASEEGHKDVVNLLLAAGVDVHAVTKYVDTALHLASPNGNKDLVNLLLTAGADVNAVDENGLTALHLASYSGHVDTVSVLLAAGANVHAVTKYGSTALHIASYYGHVDTVNLLLDAGADVHAVTKHGKTALDDARSKGHQDVVNVLQAHLDKVNVQSQKRVIAQQTTGATAAVSAGATAAVSAGATAAVTAGVTAAVTAGATAGASNKQPVDIVKPPVERDDGMGVLTQRVGHLSRGQIPEADLMTLRYFHVRMKRDLWPFPLIDHLYEKGVIDENQLEIITITREQRGRDASIGKMLEILKVCGNHAFQLFLECLEQEDVGYARLASDLRKHRYGGAQP